MSSRSRVCSSRLVFALFIALVIGARSHAATKPVDLDAHTTNGAESQCDLNVLQTFPVTIENSVTNRTGGDAFTFSWPSAGPGGFNSSVPAGTAAGVGVKWSWTTNQSVVSYTGNSCANDACFSKTSGPDPIAGACSLCTDDGVAFTLVKGPGAGETTLSWVGGQGPYTVHRAAVASRIADSANTVLTTDLLRYVDSPPAGTIVFYRVRGDNCVLQKTCVTDADCNIGTDGTCINRGPFGVPGRSLASNSVTVSAASLTSSLITFFSPPTEIFRVTSTAGPGGVTETVTNIGSHPVTSTVAAYPPGCCPYDSKETHLLRCGDTCVAYLSDTDNCGACGNVCAEGTFCDDGTCVLPCDEGLTDCFGQCVSLGYDDDNCGACGNVCDEDSCCREGICTPPCSEVREYCGGECVDVHHDNNNCGECGAACDPGSCCQEGGCVPLACDYPSEPFGWDLCGEECVQTIVDNNNCGACGNVCGEGTCCNSEGGCGPVCGGDTQCGDACADLENDSANCGECDNVCPEGTCCNVGGCVPFECDPGEGLCEEGCVDLSSDPDNCGECGHECKGYCCYDGVCSDDGGDALGCFTPSPHPPTTCPNPDPTEPHSFDCYPQSDPLPATCPGGEPSPPEGSQCDTARSPSRELAVHASSRPHGEGDIDAPVCVTNETTQTLEPGQAATTCTPGGMLFKEVPTTLTVCGDGIPGIDGQCGASTSRATTGTFNRLVADPETPVGNAYVTPYRVHVVADTSNDGLLEPGESAGLVIETLNAGPMDITNATATLSAPEVDLSDDNIDNPVGLVVHGGSVSYGTILGTPPTANCAPANLHPASNTPTIPITVPPNHRGDTGHPVVLTVRGTVGGEPFSMDVPLTLGIADACDPTAHTRDFDGISGLLDPMANLVPNGEPVRFPEHAFSLGETPVLRLRLSCGRHGLTEADVDPPEIIALTEETRGSIDLALVGDERQLAHTRLFTWNDRNAAEPEPDHETWEYKLRTSSLGTGRFTLKIRIAGRKDYVTGFEVD